MIDRQTAFGRILALILPRPGSSLGRRPIFAATLVASSPCFAQALHVAVRDADQKGLRQAKIKITTAPPPLKIGSGMDLSPGMKNLDISPIKTASGMNRANHAARWVPVKYIMFLNEAPVTISEESQPITTKIRINVYTSRKCGLPGKCFFIFQHQVIGNMNKNEHNHAAQKGRCLPPSQTDMMP